MPDTAQLHFQKPFILVDGSSYLYRAFHALPPLMNSKGQPTGAVYGVINMLRRLILDYQPDYIAVVFDAKGKTFRDDLYPQYKAHRPPMPDELRLQIEPLHAIVRAMGLPLLMIDGVEADDVIGTLAAKATQQNRQTLISTGDKDMAQLVNEHVALINTMSGEILEPDSVAQKFGVRPEQMIDYLTLVGDTTDNIPGVPNVGPKTAAKLLKEYQSLDALTTHANDISGKLGENLRNSLAQLPLSRKLVTIKLDVPLGCEPQDLAPKPRQTAELIELFKQLEFKTWLSELLGEANATPPTATTTKQHYEILLTESAFQMWLKRLETAALFAFDTETTDLDYMRAELVGVSFALTPKEAAYIPLAHDYLGAPQQLDRQSVLDRLKPILENSDVKKVGHNLKYDIEVLANYGITLQGVAYDTILESYVLNSAANRHDMDGLALKYLGYRTIHFEDVAGKGAKQLTFNQIPLEQAGPYAAEDADITLQLHQTLWPKIADEPGLKKVFTDIELPLISILAKIERDGVLIDTDMLHQQSLALADRIQTLEKQAYDIAEQPFNLNSPKQLQEILFNKLGLPILQKTPTGQPSTAEDVLQELAYNYPLPKIILEYRGLSKLKSTYTDRLPEQINPTTGRVHTSYNQTVVPTGRLSSSDPNLQNIPVRTEEGRKIRQAFIVPTGYKMIAADYSQIELRIMAHLSQDPNLLNAFRQGADIHQATAAEVFGVPLAAVNSEHRRSAKAINFGLIYGMSSFGLARQLNIDRKSAQDYIDRYFARYPGVKHYMENTRRLAHQQGYVETLFGRRLYLPEINTRNQMRQKAAERAAINAPLQGTAADIIKRAMIHAAQWIATSGIDVRMIMQVHDELVFEVAEKDVPQAKIEIERCMTSAAELDIPLLVSINIGNNWDEAH